MEELEELYQHIILQHSKKPKHEHALDPCTGKAEGYNPLCGDELTVYVREQDNELKECSFQAQGCAISRASASIMASRLAGRSLEEVRFEVARLVQMLTTSEEPAADLEELGDLAALIGVRKFPARIKCATLAWHALEKALGNGE